MGKGDKKTRRGKLFSGSFGVRRRKNKPVSARTAQKAVKEKEIKEVKPVVHEVKAAKPAPAKKEIKPKKSEEPA